MLPKTFLLLGLAASSTFAGPSVPQEDVQPDRGLITNTEDRERRLRSVQDKLALRRSLQQDLVVLRDLTASTEAKLNAEAASRNTKLLTRIASLKESVAEAPAKIADAQTRLKNAKKELELANSRGFLGAHSTVMTAKKNSRDASRDLTFYTVLLEGNTKALAEWNELTSLEQAGIVQQHHSTELGKKLQIYRAGEASLEQRIALIEDSLQIERKLFDVDLEFDLDVLESMANSTRSRDEVPVPRNLIVDDFLLARATGAAQMQPLLVNFTAHTSVNARRMEVTVFKFADVAPLLANFTEARLHSDTSFPTLRDDIEHRAREIAGTTAVPIYVVLDPRSGEELGRFSSSTPEPAKFAAFLTNASKRLDRSAKPATDTDLWRRIFELEDKVLSFTARQGADEASKSVGPGQSR